ncbi:MAG: hypothetical protein R3250_00255 [Melioribacteraceae bacterium]|nr:hypothetical protein [Melioribacteraceae bacterium]
MKEQIFRKLGITYEKLVFDYLLQTVEFGNMYVGYKISSVEQIPEMIDVLHQVQNVQFGDFFQKEYLRNGNFTKRYTDIPTVEFGTSSVGIHVDLKTVLFYYLIKELQPQLEEFLTYLNSENFKQRFQNRFSENKDLLKIDKREESDFIQNCAGHVSHFEQLHTFFNLTHIFILDDMTLNFKKGRIKKILNHLENDFDFENFEFN